MSRINFLSINLLAVFLLTFSGCGGGDFAEVSGTITSDGKPVPKLRVTFSPVPIGENNAVGPFSIGVTDAEGKFSLKTRYGDPGAFVGQHTTAYQYTDIGEDAMGDIRDQMDDAREDQDQEEFEKAKQKMAKMMEKLKGRPVLMRSYSTTVTVPKGGTTDLNIELTDMGGK